MNTLKSDLYAYCIEYVTSRISRLRAEIKQTQFSANEETKSSAGDKYETGRAMAQLEIEKNTKQLAEVERMHMTMNMIAPDRVSETVIPGSFITTNKGIFYIAISIGSVTINEAVFFIITPESPIGKVFMGKKVGDTVQWNNSSYTLKTIE